MSTNDPAVSTPVHTLVRARRIQRLSGSAVEAMILFGDRVVATGAAADLEAQFPVVDRVSLDGVVVPGFHDAHAHPTMTALNLLHTDCSPEVIPDEHALVAALCEAPQDDGRWQVGVRYDHTKSTAGRIVDRVWLDRVMGDRPTLLVHVAAHWGVLNSAGLIAAGLTEESLDPRGGALGRDSSGRLNGLVYEQALFDLAYPSLAHGDVVIPPASLADRLVGLARAQAMFHAAGITSVCDALCGPDEIALLLGARARSKLTLRTSMLVAHPHLSKVIGLGLEGTLGDHSLRLLGIKAFVDGACAGGNCLLDEPFEGTDDHGMQTIEYDELADLVLRTHRAGLVLGAHANGDRAIRLLLDAHEAARREDPTSPQVIRHRIEHCSLIDDDLVRRMKRLELTAVPFGSYARFHGDKLVDLYGHQRLERMFAHRTFLDAGIATAGSSDYPCGPLEPLAGLASCVERRSLDGTSIGPSQRITALEALRLYTVGSAYACGEELDKGTLDAGRLADFVELSDDPLTVPPEELADLEVRSTWVGGRPVFTSG